MKKKALALALVLCMVIAMLPVSIFAAPLKQTAQIQPQDRIEEESLLAIEPQALPELPAEPNDGKYKINAKITKGSSHGEIELSATSANAREKVYLMANPDDGYLVKLGGSYEYYYHQMEVIYVGMDIYEITMPDGKVDLEIQFVAASGSNHNVHITVNDSAFGSVATTRTSAKENESVYLTVTPSAGYYLESLTAKDANGSDALGLYLGEEEGSGYFEVLMPTTDLYIEVKFQKMVPHRITIDTFFEDGVDGTAHVDKDYLMAGEQFYLYIDLVPSMKVSVIDTRSDEGYIPVTWVSSGKWTGIMPNCDLHIMISIERDMRTFNVEVSGTAHGQYYNNHQVQVGKTVGVRFYPDEGYRGIILDDDGVEDLVWAERDYVTFTMPKRDVNMVIAFVERYKPITLTVGKHGTATVSHTQAEEGEAVTITCVPEEGYKVDRITGVEGLVDNGDGTYTFLMPYRAVDLTVTFKNIYNPVNLTVETGLGGTASVSHEKAEEGDVVTVVCTPNEGYRIARIAGVKDLTDNGDGTYTFTMPDEAVELKVLFLRHENPFLDVNETHFFYDPVLWAVEENITAGLTADTFGPFSVCNRAQVVTFLWRAAGCPEPSGEENPFADVKAADFFYKPVLWAVENGITAGISATEFGPGLACNRAQVVTFLFRARNAQLPEGAVNPFEDVKETDFFYAPVLWALENGVTAGSDATHFNPVGQCQRAQVVTFLYRAKDLPMAYDLHFSVEGEGTITLSHTAAVAGETVTATVIPAEGWLLDRIWCENGTELTQVSDTEFTFVMPEQEEIIHASFLFPEEPPVDPEIPVEPAPTDPTAPVDPVDPEPTDPTDPAPEIPVDPGF